MMVCLLLPYFAARLARRERAVSQNTPLILCVGEKVAATCDRAAASSISVGMSVRQARWLCPEAQAIPLNLQTIRQASEEVLQTLSQFTHLIETDKINARIKPRTALFPDARQSVVFYLDLERLAREATLSLAQQIVAALRHELKVEAACGVAVSKFPAYAVATETRVGHIRVLAAGEEAAFLAALPLNLLPMPAETRRRLRLLGLETIGAFARLPISAAVAQCGKDGALLYQLAQGLDPRRVVAVTLQVVERVARTFEMPLTDQAIVEAILRAMAAELSARLEASGSMGRTLHLQLTLDGGDTCQQKTTLRQPVSSSRYLDEALRRLLARLRVASGITGMIVTLADLMPFSGQQLELFPDQPRPRERLQQRLSRLLTRSDAPACYWITAHDPAARRIEERYRHERAVPT